MKRIAVLLLLLLTVTSLNAQSASKILYVINGLGETLSMIDLTDGEVTNDIITLGTYPNDIQIQGQTAYILNSGSADINVFDLRTNTQIKLIQTLPGGNPYTMYFKNSSEAYVVNAMLGSVSVLIVNSGSIIKTFDAGTWPQGTIIAGDYLFVSITGGYPSYSPSAVGVVDLVKDSVITTLDVPMNPTTFAASADGTVYAVCSGNSWASPIAYGAIAVIDPAIPAVIDTITFLGNPLGAAITSAGKMFISAGEGAGAGIVYLYDIQSGSMINGPANPIVTSGTAMGIIADAGTDAIYVTCFSDDVVQKLDPVTGDVLATYECGDGPLALAIGYDVPTFIDENRPLTAEEFVLEQNYPNPFNPVTTIRYNLTRNSPVRLKIHSVSGQEIAAPVDKYHSAGTYEYVFDGSELASGIYYYTLITNEGSITRKMLLVK